jgi:hypothetical protein
MTRFRQGLIGLMALAGAALAPRAALADCDVGNCWGAVAFGPGGVWTYSVNEPSRAAAQQSALGQCGGRCERVLTFQNSCGAYAASADSYGWGNASTREDAEERALQECGAGCTVRVWGCTTR